MVLENICYSINQGFWQYDESYEPLKISQRYLKKYRTKLQVWKTYQTIQKGDI